MSCETQPDRELNLVPGTESLCPNIDYFVSKTTDPSEFTTLRSVSMF